MSRMMAGSFALAMDAGKLFFWEASGMAALSLFGCGLIACYLADEWSTKLMAVDAEADRTPLDHLQR